MKVEVIQRVGGFAGEAWLVKTEKPVHWGGLHEGDKEGTTQYFIVSGINAPFTGWEVLVFPSSEKGEVIDWGEIAGGRGITHQEAIKELSEICEAQEK